jgi:DNA polymerase-2
VEAHGFRVLYLYVDGLWIHKPRARSRPDYEGLLAKIHAQTGLSINLEGVYRWLAFLPSRTEPRISAANRYFGAYEDGSIKVRGIEYRRRDTPDFIKESQMGMISILAEGRDAQEFRALVPEAIAYARERLQLLRTGRVPLKQLLVSHRMSRQLEDYVVRTVAVRAATQLTRAGVALSPGQSVHFLYTPGQERVRAWELIDEPIPYDRQAYTELFLRAVENILMPVGVGRETLETWLLGNAGYWGPPGTLPPLGADDGIPLLEAARFRSRLREVDHQPAYIPFPAGLEAPAVAIPGQLTPVQFHE